MSDVRVARRVADAIEARGLAVPARLLIDAHRPLAPLLMDLAAGLGPLVAAAVGRSASDLRSVVEDPAGLDSLVDELDRAAARDAGAVPG